MERELTRQPARLSEHNNKNASGQAQFNTSQVL